jgi:hypothetical protein
MSPTLVTTRRTDLPTAVEPLEISFPAELPVSHRTA